MNWKTYRPVAKGSRRRGRCDVRFSASADFRTPGSEGHSQRAIAEIIGKEYPAFEGADHKTIAKWVGEFTAGAENSPPDSRQHSDLWQFATADQDAGIGSLSTTSCNFGLPSSSGAAKNSLSMCTASRRAGPSMGLRGLWQAAAQPMRKPHNPLSGKFTPFRVNSGGVQPLKLPSAKSGCAVKSSPTSATRQQWKESLLKSLVFGLIWYTWTFTPLVDQ
jgi:hypothetical protein